MAKASAKRVKKSVQTPNAKSRRGKNPNSLANLKPPWKKGDPSPNPTGRPKILSESYKAWLEKYNESAQMTNAEAVATAMGLAALRGDVGAAREIRNATEQEQTLEVKAGTGEIIFRVVRDDERVPDPSENPAP